jgi:hypothetical protein
MELKKSMSQKLRMDGRDYSRPGWYFVTLGADYHKQLFGMVEGGAMQPNAPGERACLKTLQEGKARIVWVLPMAMPKTIPQGWTQAFLESRALWLSAFSDDLENATRDSCEQANKWGKRFCE